MRFLECLKSAGEVLHGNSYLWSMMKKSSVSRMQRFMCSQILCYVLERWIRTQHQILSGSDGWKGSKNHHNTELWTQSTENRWNSSGIFDQDYYIAARPRSPKVHEQTERPRTIPRTNYLHVDVQWHQMVNWRQWKGMYCQFHTCVCICKKISSKTLVIPPTWVRNKVVFHKHIETRRKKGSLNWWWSNSEKADTQFSEPRVHCPEERSKRKEVENCQYTSVPMEIRLKLFFAQLFRLISSVSTEHSQICVRNTVAVEQEQGDLYWQSNVTHISRQQTYW